MRELEKEEAAKMEEVRRDLEARMQKVRDEEAREAAVEAERMAKEREREDRLKDREERLKQREEAVAQRAIEEIRAKEEAERAREIRAQKRLAGESAAGSRSGTPNGTPNKGKGKGTDAEAPVSENEEDGAAEEEEEPWELACEVCNQHGWNVVSGLALPITCLAVQKTHSGCSRMMVGTSAAVKAAADGSILTVMTSLTIRRGANGATGTGSTFIAMIAVSVKPESGIRQGKAPN